MAISKTKKAQLMKALHHEYYRCTDAYITFQYHLSNPKNDITKRTKILCFNAYSDFISHLFEFYIKIIERDKLFQEGGDLKEIINQEVEKGYKKAEVILYLEILKLLRNRKNRLLNGYKDDIGFDISFYDKKVSKDFLNHISAIRHRRNHVNAKRVADNDLSLTDFYNKYNSYVMILYKELNWIWTVDEESFDWGEIEGFYDNLQ